MLPTRSADAVISSYTLNDPFSNRAKEKTRAKRAVQSTKSAVDDIDVDSDDSDVIAPSRETPAEQLDIEVE